MNLKIAKTLLVLSILYIVGFYVIKFIFPDFLLLQITDPNILNFGRFVESNKIFLFAYYGITGFITFYLFLSASRGSFKINLKDLIIIILCNIVNILVTTFLPDLMVHTSTSLMFILSWLCKGKIQYAVPTFVTYGYCSQFLFSIRGFETIITKINVASSLVMGLECWMWMFLFAILFYLKEKKNGLCSTTIYEQNGRKI